VGVTALVGLRWIGAAAWLAASMNVQADGTLQLNPFGDPFLQATNGRPCPRPLGPAYTEAQRRQEAHSRIERGTSCWLAGTCSEPNAYRYDHRIASAVAAALKADAGLSGTSIWVTAQRRIVTLQGCTADAAQAARAEALASAVPDVQAVFPQFVLPGQAPRYDLAASEPAR
jgi:hypothetical protein